MQKYINFNKTLQNPIEIFITHKVFLKKRENVTKTNMYITTIKFFMIFCYFAYMATSYTHNTHTHIH